MNSKNLIICDEELEYAKRLADYIGGKRELALQVKICESPDQIAAVLGHAKIDILLADEKIKFSAGSLEQIPSVLYLSDSETDTSPDHEPRIFRYQSAEDIYRCLIEQLTKKEQGEFWAVRRKERGRLIGFYTPVHRLGQTTNAIRKGIELSKEWNVLYLNMEGYAGVGVHFPEEKERNLSMLLYYAKQETGNPGLLITTLVQQIKGLDYIPPVTYPEELKAVTVKEWMWLFREILERSIYDVLILDLGEGIQGLFEILKNCDEVYMMTAGDKYAVSKLCQYEQLLYRQGYGGVWERMIHCDIRRSIKD